MCADGEYRALSKRFDVMERQDFRMRIDELLQQRSLVFVSGKGGVGKTAVAASLALRARALGRTPLLFECDVPTRASPFGNAAQTPDAAAQVAPGLWAVNQSTDEALKDYLGQSFSPRRLVDLLFDNAVTRTFLRSSPSVAETAMVGRMVQEAERHAEVTGGVTIVDLPATGHAVSMMKAPAAMMDVLGAGPIFEHAAQIRRRVFDASFSAFLPVAFPEELPVTESLEMVDVLRTLNVPLGPVVLNGMPSDPEAAVLGDDAWSAIAQRKPLLVPAIRQLHGLQRWFARAARERTRYLAGIRERCGGGHSVYTLPYVFSVPNGQVVADVLEEAFGAQEEAA